MPKKRSRLPLLIMTLVIAAVVAGAFMVSMAAQPATPVTLFTARTINAPTGVNPEGYAYAALHGTLAAAPSTA